MNVMYRKGPYIKNSAVLECVVNAMVWDKYEKNSAINKVSTCGCTKIPFEIQKKFIIILVFEANSMSCAASLNILHFFSDSSLFVKYF